MPTTLDEARELISVSTRRYSDLVIERDQLLRVHTGPAPISWCAVSDLHDAAQVMQDIHKRSLEAIRQIRAARARVDGNWPTDQEQAEDAERLSEDILYFASQIETNYAAVEFSSRSYADKVAAATPDHSQD
jgi:hypothetical protein